MNRGAFKKWLSAICIAALLTSLVSASQYSAVLAGENVSNEGLSSVEEELHTKDTEDDSKMENEKAGDDSLADASVQNHEGTSDNSDNIENNSENKNTNSINSNDENSQEKNADSSNSDEKENKEDSYKLVNESKVAEEKTVNLDKADDHKWDFSNSVYQLHVEGNKDIYENMLIDATAFGAKCAPNNSQWAQVNANTKFYIPVKENSKITIMAYDGDLNLTINESKMTCIKGQGCFLYEYENKENAAVLELKVNSNTYFAYIEVKKESSAEDEENNKEVAKEETDYYSKFNFPVSNTEWDFTDYQLVKDDNGRDGVKFEKGLGFYHNLYIDATKDNAKFNARENGAKDDVQVNDGTVIVVPFNRAGKLSFSYFSNGGTISIDGENYTSGSEYEYTGKGYGFVVLNVVGQIYLYDITVTLPSSAFDQVGNGSSDVWDFGLAKDTKKGAVNEITDEVYRQLSLLGSYTNKLGQTTIGAFEAKTNVKIGDLTLNVKAGDRIYTKPSIEGKTIEATNKKGIYKFSDGYESAGYYYANGASSSESRNIEIANVKNGQIIEVYAGSKKADGTLHFVNESESQNDTAQVFVNQPSKTVFTAKEDGTFKIYMDGENCKPDFYRVVRKDSPVLSGKLIFPEDAKVSDDYSLELINKETGKVYKADIDYAQKKYAVVLANGEYEASIKNISGYHLDTNSSNTSVKVDISKEDNVHDFEITGAETVVVTGKVEGFDEGFDFAGASLKFSNSKSGDVYARISEDKTYSTVLDLDKVNDYEVSLDNCNDYILELTQDNLKFIADSNKEINYVVVKNATYKVSGRLINVPNNAVTKLTFTNTADGKKYETSIEQDSDTYSIFLRDGKYQVKTDNAEYKTSTVITVDGSYIRKDLFFDKAINTDIKDAKDIYVGYPDKELNFNTVSDAVKAVEDARNAHKNDGTVTVHIAPGTYREQVIITAKDIHLVGEGTVKITWYYGIGYTYYSAVKGYYNKEAAFNKSGRGAVDKWGASVLVKSSATGFKAENIIFENSFNRYVTEEEIKDGVKLDTNAYSDSKIKVNRTFGMDAASVSATERACALAIEGTDFELYRCSVLGSQDTLYTGPKVLGYIRNSLIMGNTDYIFGYGDVVFEGCELNFAGYTDGDKKHSYITANRGANSKFGYLFNNCRVTGSSNGMMLGASYFGRPWDNQAKVTYKDTLVTGMKIKDYGWHSMSGTQPYNVNYKEYNTKITTKVVTKKDRIDDNGNEYSKVFDTEQELGLYSDDYFTSFIPVHFISDKDNINENSFVTYTVYFKDAEGNTLAVPEIRSAQVGSRIKAADAKFKITGYEVVNNDTAITLSEKDNSITIVYKKAMKDVKICYRNLYTGEDVAQEVTKKYECGDKVTEVAPIMPGHKTMGEKVKSIVVTDNDTDNEIDFFYIPDKQTVYVRYYDYYTGEMISDEITFSQLFGTTVDVTKYIKEINNYNYEEVRFNNSEKKANSTTFTIGVGNVIGIFYKKNIYEYEIDLTKEGVEDADMWRDVVKRALGSLPAIYLQDGEIVTKLENTAELNTGDVLVARIMKKSRKPLPSNINYQEASVEKIEFIWNEDTNGDEYVISESNFGNTLTLSTIVNVKVSDAEGNTYNIKDKFEEKLLVKAKNNSNEQGKTDRTIPSEQGKTDSIISSETGKTDSIIPSESSVIVKANSNNSTQSGESKENRISTANTLNNEESVLGKSREKEIPGVSGKNSRKAATGDLSNMYERMFVVFILLIAISFIVFVNLKKSNKN